MTTFSISTWIKDKADAFTQLETWKKGLCIAGFFAGIELILFINQRFNNVKDEGQQVIERDVNSYDHTLSISAGDYTTIDDQNPNMSKTKDIIKSFIQRIKKDNLLSEIFDAGELISGSVFVKTLQNYFIMHMGGPYIQDIHNILSLGLKNKQSKLSKHDYSRWLQIWSQTLQQFNISNKNIWDDLPIKQQ